LHSLPWKHQGTVVVRSLEFLRPFVACVETVGGQLRTMIDERRTAQASRYVLGTLSGEELRDFETALRLDPRLGLLVEQLRGTGGGRPDSSTFLPSLSPQGRKEATSAIGATAVADSATTPLAKTVSSKTPGWIFWTPWMLSACFAVLCVVLISSWMASRRAVRERSVEYSGLLEQKRREIADLQRQMATLNAAAAEKSTNHQHRLREAEAALLKSMEQLIRQGSAVSNQLFQALGATNRELAVARTQVEQLSHSRRALEDAVANLGARERDRFNLVRLILLRPGAGETAAALGAAFWSPNDQRGVLAVEGLAVLPTTQGYQLWLTDANVGAPVSGGLLPVSGGSARVQFTSDARIGALQRVFVTVESGLGAAAPGGRVVLSGN